jgi:methionine synthase II (cobalamin-independent)
VRANLASSHFSRVWVFDAENRMVLYRFLGEERLWVSLSCGFGRHPPRDIPVLRAKVENMVEAARTL